MSYQAVEAVQDYSKIDDHAGLCIMYAIARYADANGVAGANTKETSPSVRTLAEKARVHRNTVINWLPKLEAAGELKIERFGKGRGAWNRYTIMLPIENNGTSPVSNGTNGTSIGTSHVVPIDENNVTSQMAQMAQRIDLMAQKIELMAQEMAHIGTSHVVTDTYNTNDTKEYIYKEPDSEIIAAIKTAVSETVKTPLWEKTAEDYDSAAYTLIGWDATPDKIRGFSSWWEANGHYPGKPALKSFLMEWQNYAAGVTMTKDNVQNGATHHALKNQPLPAVKGEF